MSALIREVQWSGNQCSVIRSESVRRLTSGALLKCWPSAFFMTQRRDIQKGVSVNLRLHYASSIWHWKCRNRRRKCNRRIRRSALFDRCLPNTTIHQQRVLSLFASEERRSVTWPAVKLTSAILLIFWIHNPVSAEGGGNSHPSIFHTFFWNLITVDIFKRF